MCFPTCLVSLPFTGLFLCVINFYTKYSISSVFRTWFRRHVSLKLLIIKRRPGLVWNSSIYNREWNSSCTSVDHLSCVVLFYTESVHLAWSLNIDANNPVVLHQYRMALRVECKCTQRPSHKL